MVGPRRVRLRRGGGRRETLFFPPRYEKYSRIVDLRSPAYARLAAAELEREFRTAETRDKKVLVKRVTVLAANRAKVMSQNPRLEPSTRREKREVEEIYRKAARRMMIE